MTIRGKPLGRFGTTQRKRHHSIARTGGRLGRVWRMVVLASGGGATSHGSLCTPTGMGGPNIEHFGQKMTSGR